MTARSHADRGQPRRSVVGARAALFDMGPTGEQWTGSRALVPFPRGICPDCGDAFAELSVSQGALFRHGGYGATERTVVDRCFCGYRLVREITEVNPRHNVTVTK